MSATIQTIKDQVAAWDAEDAKFTGGNSAAGTRARKALAELSKSIKARRNEITAEKNARKEAKAAK
jgi:tripartite-type tricarboxylate transporter receptor subunit TctC